MEELQNAGNRGKILFRALLLGLGIYGLFLMILDGVFFFTSLSENYMGWTSAGALCLGCFCAGVKAGAGLGKRGLFWGLLTGGLLTAGMAILMKLTGGIRDFSDLSMVKFGICVFFGGLGGMIGVNRR